MDSSTSTFLLNILSHFVLTYRGYLIATGLLLIALIYFGLTMRTKRFYIVRHGRTILNAKRIRQGAEGGLDPAGQAQARAAGQYLAHVGIQKIIASPYERTIETAALINESLHVKTSYSPLLAERRNPSDIIGKSAEDPEVEKIVDQMDLAYHDDNFRHLDEENFQDLKTRARKCLDFLASQRQQRICVVTHSIFLKMLLSYLLYREELHAPDSVKLAFFNPAENGGMTICEYRPWLRFLTPTHGWSVLSYNETPEA